MYWDSLLRASSEMVGLFVFKSEGEIVSHSFSKDSAVRHSPQGPKRVDDKREDAYTIVALLPIEMDGRLRYRIRSCSDCTERIVTEEQIAPLG